MDPVSYYISSMIAGLAGGASSTMYAGTQQSQYAEDAARVLGPLVDALESPEAQFFAQDPTLATVVYSTAIASQFTGSRSDAEDQAGTVTDDECAECTQNRGRFQAQGYYKKIDPIEINISAPWSQPNPPIKQEGYNKLSQELLIDVTAVSPKSAGLRKPAFTKMSTYITRAPSSGYTPANSIGYSVTEDFRAVKNLMPGVRYISRNAPRIDLEIKKGTAFVGLA